MKKPICTTASARAFLIGDEKCGLAPFLKESRRKNPFKAVFMSFKKQAICFYSIELEDILMPVSFNKH
ncbi:MAG: hypothetical protein A2Z83_02525 [Omnitrophica bacterium GWA2_52_8]|nr:MAG: hypothetical protein A2Z83_02525 [Omnitrophica bacterium GWA2_52_8]